MIHDNLYEGDRVLKDLYNTGRLGNFKNYGKVKDVFAALENYKDKGYLTFSYIEDKSSPYYKEPKDVRILEKGKEYAKENLFK